MYVTAVVSTAPLTLEQPPYKPSSPTNPLNTYGLMKRDGEQALWDSKHKGGVVRVPLLYGPVISLDESSVTSLVQHVQVGVPAENKTPVAVDDVHIRFPTFALDVANVVRRLSDRRSRHCALTGTWHFSGPEAMTKYEMVRSIAAALGESAEHVSPQKEVTDQVPRPINAKLDITALKLMSIAGKPTTFDSGLEAIKDSLKALA